MSRLSRKRRHRRLMPLTSVASGAGQVATAPDDERAVDVSPEEFRQEVEAKHRVFSDATEPSPTVRLWDLVDNSWTAPLPRRQAMEYNLPMIVDRCSACTTTSLGIGGKSNDIPNHIRHVLENGALHADAPDDVIQYRDGPQGTVVPTCVVCGKSFARDPWQARRHRESVLAEAERHEGAVKLTVRRFALGPPGPEQDVALDRNGAVSSPGVAAHGEKGRRRRRTRRRRRREGSSR